MYTSRLFQSVHRLAAFSFFSFAALSTAPAEEKVVLSWDSVPPGSVGYRWSDDMASRWNGTTYLASGRAKNIEVMDSTSEEGQLFGSIPVFRVIAGPEGAGTFALRGRPFEKPVKKGGLEFYFSLVSGKVRITLGQNPTPFVERNDQTVLLSSADTILTIGLEPLTAISIDKVVYQTSSVATLKANQAYKLRIMWDFEDATPHITMFLDGEPLYNATTTVPMAIKVLPAIAARGIDSYTFSGAKATEGSYILATILAIEP